MYAVVEYHTTIHVDMTISLAKVVNWKYNEKKNKQKSMCIPSECLRIIFAFTAIMDKLLLLLLFMPSLHHVNRIQQNGMDVIVKSWSLLVEHRENQFKPNGHSGQMDFHMHRLVDTFIYILSMGDAFKKPDVLIRVS